VFARKIKRNSMFFNLKVIAIWLKLMAAKIPFLKY